MTRPQSNFQISLKSPGTRSFLSIAALPQMARVLSVRCFSGWRVETKVARRLRSVGVEAATSRRHKWIVWLPKTGKTSLLNSMKRSVMTMMVMTTKCSVGIGTYVFLNAPTVPDPRSSTSFRSVSSPTGQVCYFIVLYFRVIFNWLSTFITPKPK